MLKIKLFEHDNYYGLSDIARLFFGRCVEDRDENLILCPDGPDKEIISDPDRSLSGNPGMPLKRAVKVDLYRQLNLLTGLSFPWGSLTGIRPAIIACEESFDYRSLMEKYFVREDKARLACETARTESRISEEASNGLNIYVGVPFCPGRCEYCSFIAEDSTHHLARLGKYADALINEMSIISPYLKSSPVSVYMGGGTPTVFDEKDFGKVANAISRSFRVFSGTEFTVEAGRPDTITKGKLESMRRYGVSRICINPQSMRDETLRLLGRSHTASDTVKAYELSRSAGFKIINMDLIAGLKYETADDFLTSVRAVAGLSPENITIHTLYKKRRARISRDDVISGGDRGDVDSAVRTAYEILRESGYSPYYMYRQKDTELGLENVGFCKDGTYSIYNVAMMSSSCQVLSVGAGAMSKRTFPDGRFERCANVKDVSLYMKDPEAMARRKIEFFGL